MPSSLIFTGLVVFWLLILVPASPGTSRRWRAPAAPPWRGGCWPGRGGAGTRRAGSRGC